jgi:ubiquinone/menaquinone biosynthesis C-methylase UbiE
MLPPDVEAHIEQERERYDAQFSPAADRNLLVRFGAEFRPSDQRAALLYAFDQLGDLRGQQVLEIGGGTGWHAAMLVHRGAHVTTTDVSPVGVEIARRRFEVNRMTERTATAVVAAETMPFDDASFDAVFGIAVLHHLVLERAAPEIARVLRPGGRAVFIEPLSENPVLDFVRDYVPYPGKKSPLGHRGVTFAMLDQFASAFATVQVQPFYLTSMINRAFGQGVSIVPLERLDAFIARRFPATHRLFRYTVITAQVADRPD